VPFKKTVEVKPTKSTDDAYAEG
jgi:hypothetical protein